MTPLLTKTLGIGFFIALIALSSGSAFGEEAVRLINGNWYDGKAFEPREFYAVDGVLRDSWGGDATVVDLAGLWVVPGFGNAHTHGIGNDDHAGESRRFLEAGVFYVANPNNFGSRVDAARSVLASSETVDARFANGGLTSTGGHPIQIFESNSESTAMDGDAYFIVDDRGMLEDRWPKILEGRPDFIKIYLERSEFHAERKDDPAFYGKRGLDPALVPAIVERAHGAGLRVAAHVTSRYDFGIAIDAGVDEIAHLPLEELTPDDAKRAASQEIVLVTTVLSHRPAGDVEDLDALHRDNLTLLREAGVSMALGTDSHASVLDELWKLESLNVFEPGELLHMLVHDTPRWLFPSREIGRLDHGAEADFLVLEENPLNDLAALGQVQQRFKAGHLLDIQKRQTDERPGIGQQLVHSLMGKGIDAAIAEYHRLRAEEPDGWDFSEPQLNALGYAMINHGKIVEATAIFQLNCEQYPESSNAWDSLGEAWIKRGDIEAAIESYERALRLDPGNQNAKEKLAELRGR